MAEPISRNAFKKALVIIICLAAAIVATKLYLKTIGVLILLAVLIYGMLSTRQFANEKRNLSGTIAKPDKILIGKSVQFLQYVIYGLIAIAVIKWVLGQMKMKG